MSIGLSDSSNALLLDDHGRLILGESRRQSEYTFVPRSLT